MCGRFTLHSSSNEFADQFGAASPDGLCPRYNIAPSQAIAIIRAGDGTRRADLVRWGLIPSWAKDPKIGSKMINARAETIFEKPSYRSAIRQRRCLIPADGFYEWKTDGKVKTPHWIHLRDEALFAFAGIWERWISPDGEVIDSTTIVTTTANEVVRQVHERMPVILARDNYAPWLDPALQDPARLSGLMVPYPAEEMVMHPVSSRVNSPRVDAGIRHYKEEHYDCSGSG